MYKRQACVCVIEYCRILTPLLSFYFFGSMTATRLLMLLCASCPMSRVSPRPKSSNSKTLSRTWCPWNSVRLLMHWQNASKWNMCFCVCVCWDMVETASSVLQQLARLDCTATRHCFSIVSRSFLTQLFYDIAYSVHVHTFIPTTPSLSTLQLTGTWLP